MEESIITDTIPPGNITIDVVLRCKNQSISLRCPDSTFHMMLVWDKAKPKPANLKEAYQEMYKDLEQLLIQHNNQFVFKPIVARTNSTYGELEDWLYQFVQDLRSKYDWLNKEKDLPVRVDDQTEPGLLFAHMSRREIQPSELLERLKDPKRGNILFKVTSIRYK